MKKIFFFACILACSFASAQQNEFFDIQKYMQKKQKDSDRIKFKIHSFPENIAIAYYTFSLHPRLINELHNGSKVYALPQDHMPCLIPDMSQFNMLNSFKRKKYAP